MNTKTSTRRALFAREFGRMIYRIIIALTRVRIINPFDYFQIKYKTPAQLASSERNNFLLDLPKHEKSCFSQNEQDGVLWKLFEHIPTINSPPFCVEFGFCSTSLTNRSISNAANLILKKGWNSLFFDGSHENCDINLHKVFITSKNIAALFEKHGVPKSFEYLGVDIDSTDLWVLSEILKSYRPTVITIEYNPNFPIDATVTFPDDPGEFWESDAVFGCSVGAIELAAKKNSYKIVYVGKSDVYLVAEEALQGLTPLPLSYFASAQMRCPRRLHKPCTSGREKIMIDYSVWMETGDMNKAREAAQKVAARYLTWPSWTPSWIKKLSPQKILTPSDAARKSG